MCRMGMIRRGNHVFVFWTGVHPSKHVHVRRDSRLVAKRTFEVATRSGVVLFPWVEAALVVRRKRTA